MLKVSDVEATVEKIRKLAHDDEWAHSAEDELYRYVLQSIAHGTCEDPAACAAAALATETIKFERWRA